MELRSQMAVKESELKFLVSAAHSSESKLFWSKNVWKVVQILFLVTIVNAIIVITFSFCYTQK